MKKVADITLMRSRLILAASLFFAFLLTYKNAREPEMDIIELAFISMTCLLFLFYYLAALLLFFSRTLSKKA